jgi:polysaccharide export outer membrane protein
VIDVDIKKIRDGKAADPILQANDIVFLPTDDMKAVLKNLGVGGVIGLVSLLYVVRSF